jgi:hypothetical protein
VQHLDKSFSVKGLIRKDSEYVSKLKVKPLSVNCKMHQTVSEVVHEISLLMCKSCWNFQHAEVHNQRIGLMFVQCICKVTVHL